MATLAGEEGTQRGNEAIITLASCTPSRHERKIRGDGVWIGKRGNSPGSEVVVVMCPWVVKGMLRLRHSQWS